MSHYFDQKPSSKEQVKEFHVRMFDQNFHFVSSSGMFSVGHLDKGTEILITYAHIKPNDALLDLGCSYGPVGIIAAKHYGVQATLVDINERAIAYAKKNAALNNVKDNCTILVSNGFEKISDKKFSTILFNPPQHAGKQLCLDLIKQSKDHLIDGGSLQVVARHNVGGKSFENYMQELFGNVEAIAKKSGFRVYKSIKN